MRGQSRAVAFVGHDHQFLSHVATAGVRRDGDAGAVETVLVTALGDPCCGAWQGHCAAEIEASPWLRV